MKVLLIIPSDFISGAEQSLFDFIDSTTKDFSFIVTTKKNKSYSGKSRLNCKTIYLPYVWFYKTLNPFKIIFFVYSLIFTSLRLYGIVRKNNIQIVYANTLKAALYGIILKYLIRIKLICHLRDNINSSVLLKHIISQNCDRIINVSKFIYNQLPSGLKNNCIIYGGIDTECWKKNDYLTQEHVHPLSSDFINIACIGQLTRWKNQTDFILAAKILTEKKNSINFFIVGDDLSGRENKYKKKLLNLVKKLDLQNHMMFYGYKEDISDIINQMDILVHPAIDEPFGRVLIEAMAVEKPVVAYNCGGPSEIIIHRKTGFLAKPKNYHQLAEKTMQLIDDKELRIKMGKAGRQRVIEKFNINRYVCEMEEMFENI